MLRNSNTDVAYLKIQLEKENLTGKYEERIYIIILQFQKANMSSQLSIMRK